MRHLLSSLFAIGTTMTILGCSSNDRPDEGFRAIHANADGDGWQGPVRRNDSDALSDADNHARENGINPDEMIVVVVNNGSRANSTRGQLPPNPLADRPLAKPVSLSSLEGNWTVVHEQESTNTRVEYFLNISAGGKCTTDFGARMGDATLDGSDFVEVVSSSCFVLTLWQGESYILTVIRFDGDEMDVLIDGRKGSPLSLFRRPVPPDSVREQP